MTDGAIWYENGVRDARVLVVDDDPDVRGLLREMLERAGCLVREARDGREALKILYDARPDIILLDVTMPDLDGWQTLERVRDLTDVPVVMLTAANAELEKVRGLQGGADDYVTKPYSPRELVARIRAVLRRGTADSVDDDAALEAGPVRMDVEGTKVLAR